jgi:thymidylate kinase
VTATIDEAVEMEPLGLVIELTDRLRDGGVTYCHWKSNAAIDRSMSGVNDLDLLVARADSLRFERILLDCGFRQARSPREVLGLEDFYGIDPTSGRVVHVQPHYELVLGDDMTKSFRIPVEGAFLASAETAGPIPLPSPEFEYIVFLLRMAVKHCPLEAQIARKGRLTRTEREELEYLEDRVDRNRVRDLVATHLPLLTIEILDAARGAVERDAGILQRARVGRRVIRMLASQGRRSPAGDLLLKVWRRIAKPRGPAGKRPARGGLIVAVVGGDGSGKSTAVEGLAGFLEPYFAVHRCHLGKPPRRGVSRMVGTPLRVLRNRGLLPSSRIPHSASHTGFPGYGFMVWNLLVARDRATEYTRVRRLAGRGHIVVCDRFPLEGIGAMDGPRLQNIPGVGERPLACRLRDLEAGFYARILPPDVVMVLRVPPSVAVERRPEQDAGFVARRASDIWEGDFNRPNVHVVDATETPEDVVGRLIEIVWSQL